MKTAYRLEKTAYRLEAEAFEVGSYVSEIGTGRTYKIVKLMEKDVYGNRLCDLERYGGSEFIRKFVSPKKKVWQAGEHAFYEFRLVKINRVAEDEKISQVDDGSCTHGGLDIHVEPVTIPVYWASRDFYTLSRKLEGCGRFLNILGIHDKLVQYWIESCSACEPTRNQLHVLKDATAFLDACLKAYKELQTTLVVEGVQVLRS